MTFLQCCKSVGFRSRSAGTTNRAATAAGVRGLVQSDGGGGDGLTVTPTLTTSTSIHPYSTIHKIITPIHHYHYNNKLLKNKIGQLNDSSHRYCQQRRQASSSLSGSQYSNADILNYFNSLSPRKQVQLEQDLIEQYQNYIKSCKTNQQENEVSSKQYDDVNIDISNWIRSISFPKQSPMNSNSNLSKKTLNTFNNAVIVTLAPSTMLHPYLPQIKQYIQHFIYFYIVQHFIQSQDDVTTTNTEKNTDLNIQEMVNYHDFILGKASNVITPKSSLVDIQVQISQPIPTPFTVTSTPSSPSTATTTTNHGGVHVHNHSSSSSSNSGNSEVKRLGLEHVQHVLAVYSCKGGVGKSTIAVNLAYEMAQRGARVGLLDVDIYGPSLGVLVKPPPEQLKVKKSDMGPNMVHPIEYEGVKMLSLCFVSSKSGVPGSGSDGGAAVMRGPMAGRVVTQLLKGTDWGHLDCLILDMPPGTGDVQLTVCQEIELSGIVSVTTPSKLALEDAKRGLEMFTSMGIPTLGFVENMSYFECEGGGKHYPFGSSLQNPTKDDDIHNNKRLGKIRQSDIFQFPISPHTNNANESGKPLCLGRPEEAKQELDIYEKLCQSICRNLVSLEYGQLEMEKQCIDSTNDTVFIDDDEFPVSNLTITVNNERKEFYVRFFSEQGAKEMKVSGEKLRYWDPKMGEGEIGAPSENSDDDNGGGSSLKRTRVSSTSDIFPCQIYPKGNYGFSLRWADGASIIYSRLSIATAAGGKKAT